MHLNIRIIVLSVLIGLVSPSLFAEMAMREGPSTTCAVSSGPTSAAADRLLLALKVGSRGALERVGLYERFKKIMVSFVARPRACSVVVHGVAHPVIKYLGSGLNGDAYIIDYEGTPVVAKVARETPATRNALLTSIPVHRYAHETLHLSSPRLIAFDPEGNWELSELVLGESLEKKFARGERLSPALRDSVRRIFELASQMKRQMGVTLDLAADNILVSGDTAVLVDLGPISTPSTTSEHFEKTMEHWQAIGDRCHASLVTVAR